MKLRSLFTLIFLQLLCSLTLADYSPLGATEFYSVYASESTPEVNQLFSEAARTQTLSKPMFDYLMSSMNRDDYKMALVNALGMHAGNSSSNAGRFLEYFVGQCGHDCQWDAISRLSGPSKLIYAYLLAMDSSADVRDAMNLADDAARGGTLDFSMSIVHSLIQAQFYRIGWHWCTVWQKYQKVLKRFPSYDRNLKPRAFAIIDNYMNYYNGYCN